MGEAQEDRPRGSGRELGRRALLTGALGLAGSALGGAAVRAAPDPSLRINSARLRRSLEDLSLFGRPAGGDFSAGVSRFAYSDADIAGRRFAMDLLRAAGGSPRIDAAGNVRTLRPGLHPGLKPIMIGSHLDSVPNGGNFDGALGSMAAVEIFRTLQEGGRSLRHPLEVVFWSNEEGGTVGSGLAAGVLGPSALELSTNGIRRSEGLLRIGGDPKTLASALIPRGALTAYVELHIEQSGLLEKAGIPVGVVDGIVAINEYEVEITGTANHAGTTPMAERRNALLAASELVLAVQEEVTRAPGRQVGTVGQLNVFPNVRNIVPGRVTLNIELRDLDAAKIAAIGAAVTARARDIALRTGTGIDIRLSEADPPALATKAVQADIEAAAAGLGLRTLHLPSGAGHDAAMLARIAPMGMIFVPSVGGVSHSPRELTSWADCANGANVLLQTVLRLDAAAQPPPGDG